MLVSKLNDPAYRMLVSKLNDPAYRTLVSKLNDPAYRMLVSKLNDPAYHMLVSVCFLGSNLSALSSHQKIQLTFKSAPKRLK